MKTIEKVRRTIEYLCGQCDEPPWRPADGADWIVTALSWVAFLFLIWVFSGQTSKFIYIDF